jgi:hypothetical protein
MPERRHLWRGIHDPEMVRAAVTFSVEGGEWTNNAIRAALSVGQHRRWPLPADLCDTQAGRRDRAARRRGPQSAGNTHRAPDSTAGPSRSRQRNQPTRAWRPTARSAWSTSARRIAPPWHLPTALRVEPDEFYARFYRALLADGAAEKGRELIALALKQAESSSFLAFEERRVLPQR